MEIDWTVVAFEALNFAVLVLILRRFLFRPIATAIEDRRNLIEAQHTEMEAREAAATAQQEAYESKRGALEAEMKSKTEAAMADAERRAGEIIEASRERSKALVAATTEECDLARARALQELRLEVFALAVDAATCVVRHMGTPSVARSYARRAGRTLQGLLDEGHATSEEPIAIHVGSDADPDELTEELRGILDPRFRFSVQVDPEIVAGVRLQIAGHEVEASASSSLQQWYERRVVRAG